MVLNELEVNNICFSDEATLYLNGCVNKQNRFVYTMDNPKMVAEDETLCSPGITCWAMVSPDFVIVYELLDTMMNAEQYKGILEAHVILLLMQHCYRMKISQQDGASPHFAIAVCLVLDSCLTNRWIGQAGSIS